MHGVTMGSVNRSKQMGQSSSSSSLVASRVLLRFHPLQCDLLALLSHLDHKLIRDQSPGSSELSTEFRRDALVLDLISPDEGIVILGDECRMVANLSQAEKQRKHMVVVLENRASS